MKTRIPHLLAVMAAPSLFAAEFHVATSGRDTNRGSAEMPLKTISAAAKIAMPGDTITVHHGVYRERVNPPRGGTSETNRITYRAAVGETPVITGSEPVKGWEKVSGDTWKLTLPNSYFGDFNPFAERIGGDWFDPQGMIHHRGCVYQDNTWLKEAATLDAVLKPAQNTPLWFAHVDGAPEPIPEFLLNVATIKVGSAGVMRATNSTANHGTQHAPNIEGGQCVGYIRPNDWLRYDHLDFGDGAETIEIRAAASNGTGGEIELRLDQPNGELLGLCEIPATGDWQKWQTFSAKITKTSGSQSLCMVFKPKRVPKNDRDNTIIYAQFPNASPNESQVEISVRPTVFTPEKSQINYITVRGFKLCNAATNWCAPTMGQVGLISAYWCKGWIIEDNEIFHSRCSGIALGKYSDQWDGKRGSTEGYYLTIEDALKKGGWSKEKIGSHLVRNNQIHHCGQNGIVGSLGCAFSRIIGNEIHDINLDVPFGGAEMAGIKLHGAIDVTISRNHIYQCGNVGGIWLDWMAQGTQIIQNLLHDNHPQDLFCEVDHGPYLVANNLFLSPMAHLSNSRGGAYVHNLVLGRLKIVADTRRTPFMNAHSTQTAGLNDCPVGDARWINNLLGSRANLNEYDQSALAVKMAGNVFTKGSQPAKSEINVLSKPNHDLDVVLSKNDDGWYLTISLDPSWSAKMKRTLVTTGILGNANIPNVPFENPDGSSVCISTDYFGQQRNQNNPYPGPFEIVHPGKQKIKVWPVRN